MKVVGLLLIVTSLLAVVYGDQIVDEPTVCEVCKYFVTELQDRLDETGKSREVLRTGHGLDVKKKKSFAYRTSELRLVEAMDGICDKILQYNMHKERTGSLRFAKGQSETMKTLHGLVNKGVKVDLGIPYDLWDEPSAEVTLMKKQCERMLEEQEELIEDWYFHKQESKQLMRFLCNDTVLKNMDKSCLDEKWTGKETKYEKGDTSKNTEL